MGSYNWCEYPRNRNSSTFFWVDYVLDNLRVNL